MVIQWYFEKHFGTKFHVLCFYMVRPKYDGTMFKICGSTMLCVHVIFQYIYHVFLDMVKPWYYWKYLEVQYYNNTMVCDYYYPYKMYCGSNVIPWYQMLWYIEIYSIP